MHESDAPKQSFCPVCSSATTIILLDHSEYPYFTVPVSKLAKKEILSRYSKNQLVAPLSVRVCESCCHTYIFPLPRQDIIDTLYSNYYSYPSPLKTGFEPERDNRFLEFFMDKVQPVCSKRGLSTVLEIGCYDGYILHHLQQKGYTATGCDPSGGSEIGREFGIEIMREFFDPEVFASRRLTFDIIISRHFIEHTIDPLIWVRGLKKVLNPNGILVIEAPNVSFYLERGLIEVFSLQHLQGFSSSSLNYVLNREGLKAFVIEKTPDNLIAIAEEGLGELEFFDKNWKALEASFDSRLKDNKVKIRKEIREYLNGEKRICLWGAGGFALTALLFYGIPAEKVEFIIDSDREKRDMEYLNYSIPIVSIEDAIKQPPDLIIITSMYSKSIKEQILKIGFSASILTIFPKVHLA
jgi:SAM-dependent methyltransferase